MININTKTLLLVEDDLLIAIAERKALEKYGYAVVMVNSGTEAIEVFNSKPGIDLILMDIDLGNGIDGAETASVILKQREIPIVFLSSYTDPEVVDKTEKITSYGYVVKNSGITVLDASIKMAFKLFEAKEKLYEQSIRNDAILKAFPDALMITDLEGHFLVVTKPALVMFGCETDEDMLGHRYTDFVIPEERELALNNTSKRFSGEIKGLNEYRGLRKDGSTFDMDVNGEFIRDADGRPLKIVFIVRDITDRKYYAAKIQSLLSEKELILKEVHHRVKNYMNTIKGLLYLQSSVSSEPSVTEALDVAVGRVQSMMILYDKLYLSENYGDMSFLDYMTALIDDIISIFSNSNSVMVLKKIDDFILNSKVLQSIGIIVNEIITNIMKYAFVNRDCGLITVVSSRKDNKIRLEIIDNGVGIPESVNFENSKGFGLHLVRMLAEQIGGTISIVRGEGTMFILEFEL